MSVIFDPNAIKEMMMHYEETLKRECMRHTSDVDSDKPSMKNSDTLIDKDKVKILQDEILILADKAISNSLYLIRNLDKLTESQYREVRELISKSIEQLRCEEEAKKNSEVEQ